ncbi:SusD/RagB family nutrient-binding outer membrane lipoprotein [Sphingobacterium sp. HJSM2_6]|uniref:SusD/RagB family nutrient-binding outer membrane lipoprotein n=1 Tax=Sphingobacterium sp. HJSM2_6 TaxID=3366264 RepID=UPI003BE98705
MKKKLIYILIASGILASSCDSLSDFGDMNENPNATTNPIPSALLANVLSGIGGYASTAQTRPALYAQYLSETQYTDASLYSTPQIGFVGYYSGHLNDLVDYKARLEGNNNAIAVANILQQYIFGYCTDLWGDLPYSESLQQIVPKYDTQEEIYKGILSTLAEAEGQLAVGAGDIPGDFIFDGDVSKWKKFANSVRLLTSLQLSKRYPGASEYAATEFKAALADSDGYMKVNADNFVITYPGENFKNPWRDIYDGRKDFAESKTMTDLMSSLNDPRQNAFGGKSELLGTADFALTSNVGFPYGLSRANAEKFAGDNTGFARVLRGDFRSDESPLVLMSAGQIALARAEAAKRGWTSEVVNSVYQEGIKLSYEQWKQAAPTAGYLASTSVALNGGAADLNKIILQRYIAHYPDGRMGWNIWRKSAVPNLLPAPDGQEDEIPRRFMYTSAEYSTNQAGVNAAVERLEGGDEMHSRIWWDK